MRAVLLLAATLLALTGCGSDAPPPPSSRPAAAPAAPVADAEALYRSWGCSVCHGVDRRGSVNAPSLVRLDSSWSVETLSSYFLDPARWRDSDPRVRKLAERYPKLTMPPARKPEDERRALASWLLSGS